MTLHLVWFKKDLRLFDHVPLSRAINDAQKSGGKVILVYLFEPDIIHYPDYSTFHHQFIIDSLNNLNQRLEQFKTGVLVKYLNALEYFETLSKDQSITSLKVYAHEEIGNGISYIRDEKMRDFFRVKKIPFYEFPTNGILRGKWQKNWKDLWQQTMSQTPIMPDFQNAPFVRIENSPTIEIEHNPHLQKGGELAAHKRLQDFLNHHLIYYRQSISKPSKAILNCSRLSAYLAFGNISIRQVYRATIKHPLFETRKKQANAFIDRLMWHCHFIQRFEYFPEMEFENINSHFNLIRTETNPLYHQAFIEGQTGYPLIDACIRCLKKTGYINFRMRSMLISFYTHHLWQPWQNISHFLAQNFLDYEPGIHYCQIQMQAGTMGIHTLRIYNPVLQSEEHDTDAEFILAWVPELKNIPTSLVHRPWSMTKMEQIVYHFELGTDYPDRIIDHEKTGEYARKTLWAHKESLETQKDAKKILKKRPAQKLARRRHG